VRAVRFAAIEAYVAGGGDVATAGSSFGRVLAEVESLGACDDDLPSTHQNLGRLRAATGDRAGAIAAFETLQRLDPSNETAARALSVLRAAP
jgi:Flp pilus assembly protein TadD